MKFKKIEYFIFILLLINPLFSFSQVDSSKSKVENINLKVDSVKVKPDSIKANNTKINVDTNSNKMENMGVAVSPSSMHLSIKPGSSVTKEITINNDTKRIYKFKIGFNDFEMGRDGKPTTLKPSDCKYCLSKFINIVPSFVELQPHEKKKIKLIITIPEDPEAYKSAWTIITVDQSVDRKPLDFKPNDKTLAMGVNNTFGFGVYIYQNPPNVKNNSVEIEKFVLINDNDKRILRMDVRNTGDGIGYCGTYVEYTNMSTGKISKIGGKKVTILPQYFRDLDFELPKILPPGKYSAVGVLDFGSKDEIVVAQLEFSNP